MFLGKYIAAKQEYISCKQGKNSTSAWNQIDLLMIFLGKSALIWFLFKKKLY